MGIPRDVILAPHIGRRDTLQSISHNDEIHLLARTNNLPALAAHIAGLWL